MGTLLLSSFHDPDARLLALLGRLNHADDPLGAAWQAARENYAGALLVPSPWTDARCVAALAAVGWEVAPGIAGPDRGLWRMVELGLAKPVERIHFCDLDRIVHWLDRYPDELLALPDIWEQHDLTMLIRTPRAFQTHPPCQVVTEGTANAVIAHRLGIPDADAFSGSYVWSRRAAASILAAPGPRDLRFYAEAVLAPFRAGCSVGCHPVEGLEWETPDQYGPEISRLGYSAWLATFESPAQWRARAEMARGFIEAALQ
ncbi:hypothetical protein [Gaiella sp.]|uniref:hypothetical protein n=1 Tax=Gaiella sp. TaxID=2663207 RepID=UPI002E2F1E4F|nr:hypothetical protein [Gaiella sp.]HEX5585285.1 hypothetical protein [Gaiella sp.]